MMLEICLHQTINRYYNIKIRLHQFIINFTQTHTLKTKTM